MGSSEEETYRPQAKANCYHSAATSTSQQQDAPQPQLSVHVIFCLISKMFHFGHFL